MSISIDTSCLFDGTLGYDLKNKTEYKKNLKKCIIAAEKLNLEIEKKSNPIINSFDLVYQNTIKKKRDQIQAKKKKLVIGLGGSSAGAKAINGYLGYNIDFFDNYDPSYVSNFLQQNDLSNFTIYIISKSGNTFETLALLNLVYQHLVKKNKTKEINNNICVIAEDSNNILLNFAKKNSIRVIFHNPYIGGRFSVFSETAMTLFETSPQIVTCSTERVVKRLKENNLEDSMNPTINAAVLLSLKEINNLNFNVNLLYEYSLKNFSYWFHQLYAESLGKNNFSLTPMTSICPKDHHSMMQLYLDGPKDKFFNIYSPPDEIHYEEFLKENFYNIENYTPFGLLEKQFKSVREVFFEKQIPHRVIFLKDHKNPLNLIELFSYFLLETILIGKIIGINPYDQPAVELVKKKIFKD